MRVPRECPILAGIILLLVLSGEAQAQGATWAFGAAAPPRRSAHGMAFDEARGRVVLFGGNGFTVPRLSDTWEWDGAAWRDVSTPVHPPERSRFSMAYDSARRRTVLFGGNGANGFLDDTWEYDGTSWLQRSPSTRPPATADHTMVYDSRRSEVVMYDGRGNGTWTYDGVTWRQAAPRTASPPSIRLLQGMAYDSRRGRTVLFAGTTGGITAAICSNYTDTWEWDGVVWRRVNLTASGADGASPAPRGAMSFTFDAARGVTLFFGGCNDRSPAPTDTWEWDGAVWRQRSPAFSPPARSDGTMVHDSQRGRPFLFSGSGNGLNDTWEWDGNVWIEKLPIGRNNHAMTYDSARKVLFLFGGQDANGTLKDDTWSFDGRSWTRRRPATAPAPRRSGAVFDSARNVVVLFGGELFKDTWEWDGSEWFLRSPRTSPRSAAALAYDSARRLTVLFGSDGMWEWDGFSWTRRTINPVPPISSAMTYDLGRSRLVLFSELFDRPGTTWEFADTAWTQVNLTTSGAVKPAPPARTKARLAYDSRRAVTVLFGGDEFSAGTAKDDTWEWNGAGWRQVLPVTRPPARSSHGMIYDEVRDRVTIFGGVPVSGPPHGDRWSFIGDTSCAGTAARATIRGVPGGGAQLLTLDGSASTGGGLTYRWSLTTGPSGAASLVSSEPVVRYVAERQGTYQFSLAVTGDGGCSSAATASFVIGNTPPIARVAAPASIILPNGSLAPADQTTTSLRLDGSASRDPEATQLSYLWTLEVSPAASTLRTRFPGLARTSAQLTVPFDPGATDGGGRLLDAGQYVFRLTVADGTGLRSSLAVPVAVLDPASLLPRADAGSPQRVLATVIRPSPLLLAADIPDLTAPPPGRRNAFVRLDGRASSDGNSPPLPLAYAWTLVAKPSASTLSTLSGGSTPVPTFAPDVPGRYQFSLTVTNGVLASAPSTTTVDVSVRLQNTPPIAVPAVVDPADASRRAGPGERLFASRQNEPVLLDGTRSRDPDATDLIAAYAWTQLEGPAVVLSPAATAPVLRIAPTVSASYAFGLMVTDQRGAASARSDVQLLVSPAGTRPPLLSLVASADTTPGTAPDLGEAPAAGSSPALRVSVSEQSQPLVRLAAFSADIASGRLVPPFLQVGWRQVAGPTVLLFSVGPAFLRTAELSAVQFRPVTHRLAVFEAALQELDLAGVPLGAPVLRRVQVAVETAQSGVPVARARVLPAGKAKDEVGPCSLVSLDGGESITTSSAGSLTYVWQQVSGPPVTLSDPFSTVTTFVSPDPASGESTALVFSLLVSDAAGTPSPPAFVSVGITPVATAAFDASFERGASLVGLTHVPTAYGEFTLAQLIELVGGTPIASLEGEPPRFTVHAPGLGAAGALAEGSSGYLLLRGALPPLALPSTVGRRWSEESRTRSLARGLNLISYPRGIPDGETAHHLQQLTGASFVARLQSGPGPAKWQVYVPGLSPPFAIESGRGYLVSSPAAMQIQLPEAGCGP